LRPVSRSERAESGKWIGLTALDELCTRTQHAATGFNGSSGQRA
jgi:hypothetical protein